MIELLLPGVHSALIWERVGGAAMSAQTIAEAKCKEIYREAQTFFDQISYSRNYGFKILNGPPLFQPPILFIGYQPGGGSLDFKEEIARGSDKHWPPTCEYATETWTLARRMRPMFGQKFLAQCVGMNAIFLRSPSVDDDYKRDFDKTTRARIEEFCLPRVCQIVEVIDPIKILAIGFDTLRLFGPTNAEFKNKKERTLTLAGQIAGRRAIATLHLSRAHISNPDRDTIRDRVLEW
jgi:hypothetical protein